MALHRLPTVVTQGSATLQMAAGTKKCRGITELGATTPALPGQDRTCTFRASGSPQTADWVTTWGLS